MTPVDEHPRRRRRLRCRVQRLRRPAPPAGVGLTTGAEYRSKYLRGWLGGCDLVGFPGEADRFGNPTWRLFLKEREERPPREGERPVASPPAELVPL